MKTLKLLALITLSLAASVAGAQVHRCKDANGKLVFSDRICDSGQTGGQIQRKLTQAEIQQEREQAYDAEIRKQDRRMSEQEREFAEQDRRMLLQQAQPQVQQPRNDWQSRKERENAGTSASSITNNGGRWDQAAQAERAARHREELRRRGSDPEPEKEEFRVKGCSANGCVDNRGGIYTGNGVNMRRNDGRQCSRQGNTIVCD